MGAGTHMDTHWHLIVNTIISSVPLLCRMNQNLRSWHDTKHTFPYVFNAFKYICSGLVVVFGAYEKKGVHNEYKVIFYLAVAVSTTYSYNWDIFMDWDLGHCKHDGPRFLRGRLMYQFSGYYYVAMVMDLFFRFGWVLTLVPTSINNPLLHNDLVQYILPILPAIEIIRRCIWGCFRLEHQHLKNTKNFEGDFVPFHYDDKAAAQSKEDNNNKKTMKQILGEVSAIIAVVFIISMFTWLSQHV